MILFSAVGSGQSCARPVTFINVIMADSMNYISDLIEKGLKEGGSLEKVTTEVIKNDSQF